MTNEATITAIDEQLAADTARARSVVAASYKVRYAEKAKTARGKKGVSKKVVARSCGDWLALEIAAICVDPETNKLRVDEFVELLDDNGVAHHHWNRTSPGWQGRLRMTGRLALQRVVAENGFLQYATAEIAAPKNWLAKHATN